ncbi:hypothetical protein PORY_000118 [Pneumocystis oryctolagi]|uniref:Uncharacterized protein n=1 Tax=Pneumocystis oryctolagi TaxID=42067 RepID=A0ACB7CG87_9ASCO|nr:hypothetical protein PORY_000118 [Pneumocystis oryctolagi]
MSNDPSVPWILYLAVQYASAPSLHTLSNLILKFPNIFSKRIILDILNFVPECTEPEEYLSFIFDGKYEGEDNIDGSQISKIQNIDDVTLSQKLKKLNIRQNNVEENICVNDEELYVWFVSRALKIEEETGLISFSRQLTLTSQYPIPPKIQEWGRGIVTTLESVINRQYNNPSLKFNIPTLRQFEALDHKEAINILLQHLGDEEILEEMNSNIILYLSYCQKISTENVWNSLWSWLLNFSVKQKNLNLIKSISSSNIIDSKEYENFSKYAMASCYCCKNVEKENINSMKMILQNLKQNLNIKTKNNEYIGNIKIFSLDIFTPENMQNYLELITPNIYSLNLLEIMVKTISIIDSQKEMRKITLSEAIYYRSQDHNLQKSLLHEMIPQNPELLNKFSDSDWIKLRNDIEWLHSISLIYKNIPKIEYESFLLYNMLKATKFDLVKNIYIKTSKKDLPLKHEIVEKICIEVFLNFFDNSPNGNITKGNMKNAYNLLQLIKQYYDSQQLKQFSYLIKVVDTLDQYSHKFTPVEIRLHNNPFEILEDFLSSNPGIYASIDKIMSISNDLILGMNKNYLFQEEIKGKILCMIAETALSQDGFNFAYDICINQIFPLFKTEDAKTTEVLKNIVWKSCFQISKKHEIEKESLENIKKRMFLLSQIINICPEEHLVEVLDIWRQYEKEQLSIKTPKFLSKTNNNSTATYSSIIESIRIPKSLFSSASKAARTLGTTLSSTSFSFNKQKLSHIIEKSITKKHLTDLNEEYKNSKLDSLTDIVTQKFTSGLGWVFGMTDDQNHTS